MLAAPVDVMPGPEAMPGGTAYEPKWDGFRAIAVVGSPVRLFSRRTNDLARYFPDVAAALAAQLPAGVVVDGELVIWSDGRLDFGALQERLTVGRTRLPQMAATLPASFVVFDILEEPGNDWRPSPYRERRTRLEALLADAVPPLQITPMTTDPGEATLWRETWAPMGVEGLMVKGLAQPYRPGKRDWRKLKTRHTTEAIVGAVVGELSAPERLVLGAYDDRGKLRIVGGTGALAALQAREIGALLIAADAHPWPAEVPAFALFGLPGQHDAIALTRVEPVVVAEISPDTAFERGRWRHSVRFVRVRVDADPAAVTVASLTA
jgi:ATP-dependent DNA ligase